MDTEDPTRADRIAADADAEMGEWAAWSQADRERRNARRIVLARRQLAPFYGPGGGEPAE